jgi:hypothetical protein
MTTNRFRTLMALLVALSTSTSTRALADESAPTASHLPSGQDSVRRGLQGSAGTFYARIFLNINVSAGAFAEPVSLAPDLYYSVTDKLQLGLVHTGPMGWQTRPGTGLCLTGTGGGCPKVYDNVGLDLMYALLFGDVFLSAHASIYVLSFSSPSASMLTVGLAGKVRLAEGLALFFDPQIGIGLTGRDEPTGVEQALFLPVELQLQANPMFQLKLFTGIRGPFDGFGDSYQIPLGLGALVNISTMIDVGLRFSFDNLLGSVPEGASRTDDRSLSLLLVIRG